MPPRPRAGARRASSPRDPEFRRGGSRAVWAGIEVVLVHDAARALTPPRSLREGRRRPSTQTAAVSCPSLPVVDTIKRVAGTDVVDAVDRAPLAAAQTPQGFPRDVLDAAYRAAAAEFTDDTALVAAAGAPITAVPGDALAFKITTPADLERARSSSRTPGPTRTHRHFAAAPRRRPGWDRHRRARLRG